MIAINGKQVDLAKAFPLTVGDEKAMEREGIYRLRMARENVSITETVKYVLWVLRKAEPALVEADLDVLPLVQLTEILKVMNDLEGMPVVDPNLPRPSIP